MNTCQCRKPATRLIKVVHTSGERKGEAVWSFDKSSHFACCEPHRHSAFDIMKKKWAEEIARGEVKVLMGRRRAAGR